MVALGIEGRAVGTGWEAVERLLPWRGSHGIGDIASLLNRQNATRCRLARAPSLLRHERFEVDGRRHGGALAARFCRWPAPGDCHVRVMARGPRWQNVRVPRDHAPVFVLQIAHLRLPRRGTHLQVSYIHTRNSTRPTRERARGLTLPPAGLDRWKASHHASHVVLPSLKSTHEPPSIIMSTSSSRSSLE